MEKIDSKTPKEIGEYILSAFEDAGPYHIESWPIYQLNFEPSEFETNQANHILREFEFDENDEYMVILRAKREHIRNLILNMLHELKEKPEEYHPILEQARNYNPEEDLDF
jgi:hypothetical protein